MKHLYIFLSLLISCNLFGQTNYKPVEDIIRKYAQYWSDPSHSLKANERSLVFAPTHQLDSIVIKEDNGVVSSRTEMDYNDLGHTTQIREYAIDSNTFNLELSSIFDFQYEIPGYPSHVVLQTYDPTTQEFVPELEMDITYDGSDRVDSVVVSLEDPLFGGGFGPFIAVKQVYNGDLLVQSRQWINVALLGGWLPSNTTDFTYDQENRLTEQITYILDFGTGDITPDSRTTYEYNAEGLQQNVTLYSWEDPAWLEEIQDFFEYYSNGTLSSEIRYYYNPDIDEWETNRRMGYPVEIVDFEYIETTYFWIPSQSIWHRFDSIIDLLNPSLTWGNVAAPTQISILSFIGGGDFTNFLNPESSVINETRYFMVDDQLIDFNLDYTEHYYYSLFESSAINPVVPEYLSVSPNPAQDQFVIDLDTDLTALYNVYTSTGAIVEKGNMSEGRTIVQTDGWSPGLYYILIRMQDGGAFVHKQIVE